MLRLRRSDESGAAVTGVGPLGGNSSPILVTGMPRSGTSWVGRMLLASGRLGYINEPFNLSYSRGAFRVPVDHWYVYVTRENEQRFLPALAEALEFRYPLARELRRSRSRTDVQHAVKIWKSFLRNRGLRPVVKEPHAVFSAEWFARRLGSEVVITVRHPAAVVSSWKRLGWSFDFAHLLEQPALLRDWLSPFKREMETALAPSHDLVDRVSLLWRVIYAVVARYERSFPGFVVLRHEDLSREPIEGFGALYDRLGLQFTAAAREVVAASSSGANPSESSIENPYATRINSRANLENWKRRLSQDEVLRIRHVTEDVAGRYYANEEWE
jgi:hypothetical protein